MVIVSVTPAWWRIKRWTFGSAKICFWNKNFFLFGADNIVDLWILLFSGGIGWNDMKYGISHAPILRKCIGNTNKSFWCQGWVQKIVQAVWSIPEIIKLLMILMETRMALKIAKIILMRTYQCRSLSSLSSCSDGDEEAFRTNGTVYPTGEGSKLSWLPWQPRSTNET